MASETVAAEHRPVNPATYEVERVTITTLFDCGSLENRNSLENLVSANVRMGNMLRRAFLSLKGNDCYKGAIKHIICVLSFHT